MYMFAVCAADKCYPDKIHRERTFNQYGVKGSKGLNQKPARILLHKGYRIWYETIANYSQRKAHGPTFPSAAKRRCGGRRGSRRGSQQGREANAARMYLREFMTYKFIMINKHTHR